MEKVEGGTFRNGLSKPETTMTTVVPKKSNQQLFSDDFWSVNCQNGDDFSVDDLLDFSKHDIIEQFPEEKQEIQVENPSSANEQQQPGKVFSGGSNLTVSCEEFHVPAGDLDDLEWLSNFVDDSFAGYSLTFQLPEKPKTEIQPPVVITTDVKPSFTSPVQTKARSKRVRTEGRVWSIGSGSLPESSSTNSSSSSSSTSYPPNSNQTLDSLILCPPPMKKQRKMKPENTSDGCGFQPARRCSHCLVQKTPQWRAGPLGAKTLCNACGVRYKSGRLLPEYRPACSPTFSTELHSNNHRKVMEMRQKKEVDAGVQSF
ncbi:GATA transcription factor 5-like [Impatiens glandulifera]|uniref:GATA transcription factor 5-like n=1 Tax=Impatiens glandulifera TaxID=253017 RepID=UPI001FB07400|nr:GATA transcription factor 5-like [Impatiens glandulifera]